MNVEVRIDPRIVNRRHGERVKAELLQECNHIQEGGVVFVTRRLGLHKVYAAKDSHGVVVIGYVKYRRGEVDYIRKLQRLSQDDGVVISTSRGMASAWSGSPPASKEEQKNRRARASEALRDLRGAVNNFVASSKEVSNA